MIIIINTILFPFLTLGNIKYANVNLAMMRGTTSFILCYDNPIYIYNISNTFKECIIFRQIDKYNLSSQY